MNPHFTQKSFNDVVFDQRHKHYGAYVLRSRYNELILRAFFWLMGSILLLGFAPSALRMLGFLADGRKIEVKEKNPEPWDTTIVVIPPAPPTPPSPPSPSNVAAATLSDAEPQIRAVDTVRPKPEEPIEKPKIDDGIITVRNNLNTDGSGVTPTDGPGTGGSVIGSTLVAGVDTSGEQRVAQVEPKFPKGNDRIQPWIVANISHSQIDRMELSGGTIYVSFVVERDGSVSNVSILKGLESVIDKEAIRLIKSMPKWEPGRNSDVPVRVRLNLPIKIHRDVD
jgi:periplasmic protein TonB